MDIGSVNDQSAIDHIFQYFALFTALLFFWFIESVYRLDKRWLIPIILFPCSIFMFILVHWEESRGKCFFASLFLFIMIIVGGLIGHSFFDRMADLFKIVSFWPYYLYAYYEPSLYIG